MAVIQTDDYRDFKLLAASASAVYFWPDNNPYWYAYAHVGNDWFWVAISSGLDDSAEPKSFKKDFPQATKLQAVLAFT